jgi:DNA-binding MarR family transcriptional regulator
VGVGDAPGCRAATVGPLDPPQPADVPKAMQSTGMSARLNTAAKLVRIRSIDKTRHTIVTVALTYRGPLLLAHALSQLTRTLLDDHLGDVMTPGDYAIYSVVLAEGKVTPSRLAGILGMPPTTLSYVIRQMQERGDLRRLRNPDDGRSVLLTLTPKGKRLTQRAMVGFGRAIEAFRAELDIDEASLLRHLEEMSAALERAIAAGEAAETG